MVIDHSKSVTTLDYVILLVALYGFVFIHMQGDVIIIIMYTKLLYYKKSETDGTEMSSSCSINKSIFRHVSSFFSNTNATFSRGVGCKTNTHRHTRHRENTSTVTNLRLPCFRNLNFFLRCFVQLFLLSFMPYSVTVVIFLFPWQLTFSDVILCHFALLRPVLVNYPRLRESD